MKTRIAWLLLAAVLLSLSATTYASAGLTGTVTDAQGKAVAGASVSVLTSDRTSVASATTDAGGKFTIPALANGSYLVIVIKGAFAESRTAVTIVAGTTTTADITLQVASINDDVTVTASRDAVEIVGRTGQPVNVVTEDEIADRAKTVVAQAIENEAGVALQRTSSSMAGIFIRGLVGNKVNVFVDGVRFSNGAQRGGVSTFLDLVEAGSLDSIEILRGPSSDQYGSDALGGSIQFLTKAPGISPSGHHVGGSMSVSGGTAHRNGGGAAFLSFMGPQVGVTGSVSGRNTGLFRSGGGFDSHAAVTRFFGVRSDTLMSERLPNTGFSQYGGQVRLTYVPSANTQFVTSYMRTNQNGADRYDQLLGGDGNLISELNNLSLDFFTARLERLGAGPFQHVAVSFGINRQIEERVNQGGQGSSTATIGHEPETTMSRSLAVSALRQISNRASFSLGGDMQWERLTSDAFNVTPATGAISIRRPRIPSNASFRQGGVYAQTTFDAVPNKVRLVGAMRYGTATYSARATDAPIVSGVALWPDDSLTTSGVGFRASAIFTPVDRWTFSGLVSRGFRAPHMTDLGTLGLTGSGFEVAAADLRAANLSGTVGTTADATAVTNGHAVSDVSPETSLNVEGTIAYRNKTFRSDLTVFVNYIHDNIQKVSLILPAGAVGQVLGGTPITLQNANGVVFVGATTVPVLVRANFDNARLWGIEHSLSADLSHGVLAKTAFTYVRSEDTATHLSPNIEGGTPQPSLSAMLRWTHASGKIYVEPYAQKAWDQTHLSSLDLGDRRTGSSRSTSSIKAFFSNGARNRGWIGNGTDGIANTADDILTSTGETVAQIITRVLGTASSSSLFTAIPGYFTYGARIGFRTGAHQLVIDCENIGDKNYRGLSWGMDAPGRGVTARYSVKF